MRHIEKGEVKREGKREKRLQGMVTIFNQKKETDDGNSNKE